MPLFHEAEVIINGQPLSVGESMTLRVACTAFQMELRQGEFRDGIGERLALGYDSNLRTILKIILGSSQ
jgi:hypothetical protein